MSLNNINIEDDVVETRMITNIPQLDKKLSFLPDGLIVLKGKAGAGKTSLALQISTENCGSSIFVSCEQSPAALLKRLVARKARISLTAITNKSVPQEDLNAGINYVKENCPFISLENGLNGVPTLEYLRNLIIDTKEKDGSNRLLLTLDSINVFIEKSQNNYQGMSKLELAKKLAAEIDDIAKEDCFSVLITVQDGKEADIAEIFQFAAEAVIEISWDRESRQDSKGFKKSKLNVTKNRSGELGTVFLNFEGDFQTFSS